MSDTILTVIGSIVGVAAFGVMVAVVIYFWKMASKAQASSAGRFAQSAKVQGWQFEHTVKMGDFRIRLVDQPVLADLILADGLPGSEFAICRSSTRHQATTLFVARFVTQPDVTIMLSRKDRHADFTLYVESETVSDIEAAALFWLAWKQNSPQGLQ